ncbi:MAG: transcription elongation factor GreA [Phycisphaerales bacterium JB064]
MSEPDAQPIDTAEAPPPPPLPSPARKKSKKAKRQDRWAHRRAEPRTLAFLWALYILAAGVMTVGLLLMRGPWALLDKDVYQYAARTMLLCVALGLTILWPMARLSQSVPVRERASGALFKDMLVLLPPTQAVIWAQAAARSGWAIDLIGAISLSLWAWPMLGAAVLATVLRPAPDHQPEDAYDRGTVFVGAQGPSGKTRTLVMLGFVLAAMLPLLALRTGPQWATMLSPVSAVFDLAHSRPVGPDVASVDAARWTVLIVQLALALIAWIVLAIVDGRADAALEDPDQPQTPAAGPEGGEPIASAASPRDRGPLPDVRGDRFSGVPNTPLAERGSRERTQEGRPMDYMTADERTKIKARLDELIANRPKITERIAEARALGDLKENAEYHSARELQGMEEAEIRRLEDRLANAKVVNDDLAKDAQVAFLGSMVKIQEVSEKGPVGSAEMVKLVGEFSEDPPDDYDEVTANSPMGTALMKARVGETVRVDAPRGVKRFEILEIL